jgi:hypothetical protein
MKNLLKIPAIFLFGSAFYSWISYDEYISLSEALLPFLNFQGVFNQMGNFFIVCIQGAMGLGLWQLSEGKKESTEDDK